MSYLSYLNCSGALVTDQAAAQQVKVKEEAGSALKISRPKMKKLDAGRPGQEVERETDSLNPRYLLVGDGEAHLRRQTPRMAVSWSMAEVVHRLVVVDHRRRIDKCQQPPLPMRALLLRDHNPTPLVGPLNCLVCAPRLLAVRFLVAQFFAERLLVVRLVLVALDKQAAPRASYFPADRLWVGPPDSRADPSSATLAALLAVDKPAAQQVVFSR